MVKHLHYNRKKRMPTASATEKRAKNRAELSIWNLFAKLEVRTLSTFFVSPENYSMKESGCQVLFADFFCYETAKTKYDALQENLSERVAKRERIEIYLKELSRAENLVTSFDDGLWNTMVDTLTIYSKERIVFRFRDGSEIEWSIR